ncbi:MAG: hypothetical protein MHM6MM_000161 [Cercozoa sp. M6MM]
MSALPPPGLSVATPDADVEIEGTASVSGSSSSSSISSPSSPTFDSQRSMLQSRRGSSAGRRNRHHRRSSSLGVFNVNVCAPSVSSLMEPARQESPMRRRANAKALASLQVPDRARRTEERNQNSRAPEDVASSARVPETPSVDSPSTASTSSSSSSESGSANMLAVPPSATSSVPSQGFGMSGAHSPLTPFTPLPKLALEDTEEEDEEDMKATVAAKDFNCSLCLGLLFDPITTPCGHTFCRECIHRALQRRKRCPLCRSRCRIDALTHATNAVLLSLLETHFAAAYERRAKQSTVRRLKKEERFGVFLSEDFFAIGRAFVLHLYERRYRSLATLAMDNSQQFLVMPNWARSDSVGVGLLCRIRHLRVLPDGRVWTNSIAERRVVVCGLRHEADQHGLCTAKIVECPDQPLLPNEEEECRQLAQQTLVPLLRPLATQSSAFEEALSVARRALTDENSHSLWTQLSWQLLGLLPDDLVRSACENRLPSRLLDTRVVVPPDDAPVAQQFDLESTQSQEIEHVLYEQLGIDPVDVAPSVTNIPQIPQLDETSLARCRVLQRHPVLMPKSVRRLRLAARALAAFKGDRQERRYREFFCIVLVIVFVLWLAVRQQDAVYSNMSRLLPSLGGVEAEQIHTGL